MHPGKISWFTDRVWGCDQTGIAELDPLKLSPRLENVIILEVSLPVFYPLMVLTALSCYSVKLILCMNQNILRVPTVVSVSL